MNKEIVNIILDHLDQLPSLNGKINSQKEQPILVLTLPNDQNEIRLSLVVLSKIVPAQIPALKAQHLENPNLMFWAAYISTKARIMLQAEQLPYADTAGNMFLVKDTLYISIEKGTSDRQQLTTGNRAFSPAGLIVVWQFLLHPELLQAPYRTIGAKAGVTIDTVSKVLKALLAEQYILKADNKKYRWNKRSELQTEWVTQFNRVLRPKLQCKRFKWLDKPINDSKLDLPAGSLWSGATAATVKGAQLIADQWTLYSNPPFTPLMKKLKLVPDPQGPIMVYESFWNSQDDEAQLVPDLLLYADLINRGTPRYLEAAQNIFKDEPVF
ncbi:MAG: type IV toxin-antitoxin system AbiEi family antitoxin [Bacteroidota bacterium]